MWPSPNSVLRTEVLNRFGQASLALWRDGDADTTTTTTTATAASSSSYAPHGDGAGAGADRGFQALRADGRTFDWNSSFMMRLELLPETHVSARVASKIMFSGKAVKLLQTAKFSGDAFFRKPQLRDIYAYLARGASPSASAVPAAPTSPGGATTASAADNNANDHDDAGETETKDDAAAAAAAAGGPAAAFAAATAADFDDYFEKCGFRRADVKRFTAKFHQVRCVPSCPQPSRTSLPHPDLSPHPPPQQVRCRALQSNPKSPHVASSL